MRSLFRPTTEHAQLLNVSLPLQSLLAGGGCEVQSFQVPKDSYLDSADIIAKLSEVAAAAAASGGAAFDGNKVCLTAAMADVVFKKMSASARRSEGDVVALEEVARACESKMAEFYELKTAVRIAHPLVFFL